jgi:hypothetical protein
MSSRRPMRGASHWFQPLNGLRAIIHDDEGRWRAEVGFAHNERRRRLVIYQVQVNAKVEGGITVAEWRSFPAAKVESMANTPQMYRLLLDSEHSDTPPAVPPTRRITPERPPPELPPGVRRRPDSHYQRVADVYTFHVGNGDPPAKRMSEDWEIPITTINRWVKEARARGFLGEARSKGRAG